MQINKIEHQVNDEMELQQIVIEGIVFNEVDESMFLELLETYSNEYDCSYTIPYIDYNKLLKVTLVNND